MLEFLRPKNGSRFSQELWVSASQLLEPDLAKLFQHK